MRFKILLFILIVAAVGVGWLLKARIFSSNVHSVTKGTLIERDSSKPLPKPEISGWLAYWQEAESYALVERQALNIKTVSPVWFKMVEQAGKFTISEVGTMDKVQIMISLKTKGIRVIPTVSSDLMGAKLTPFLRNDVLMDEFIAQLLTRIKQLGAEGVDIDLEHIPVDDRDRFSLFLDKLAAKAHQDDLTLVVSAHAQTGTSDDWEGVRGEDLQHLGKVADEVRIMAYDFHGTNTDSGAITPGVWFEKVVRYSASKVPVEKLVIGLPTYGYVWTGDSKSPHSFRYSEFMEKIGKDSQFTSVRDSESSELVFTSAAQKGWVSDHVAIQAKIRTAQLLGVDRFIVWSLGGMDEQLFN